MPAFSYKERFIPMVQDGSKTQTIRAFRKYPVRPGQVLSHFFGMRTKHCTRIIENTLCTEVKTIFILKDGRMYLAPLLEKHIAETITQLLSDNQWPWHRRLCPELHPMDPASADLLAWQDGFRAHDYYYQTYTEGLFYENKKLMLKWWNQTHDLPFCGQLIKWDPAAVKPISITKKLQPCQH